MAQRPDAADEALQPDTLFAGRFRIEAILGQGGMGAVYRVLDQRDGRKVALKQLRLGAADDSVRPILVTQFEREFHTLCQLAHPSIIEVYDYGIEGTTAFYTMELLDGQDLRERGQLPYREVCAVLRDVASSLAIMHSRRLLHRDISARNVRCTTKGQAKLIDFGAIAPMGVVKHLVGTPPFVPPEALQLQVLDGRADLYALGVLAYYVLTRRHPYPARSFAELQNAWRNVPANPRRYDPEIPEALDQLVMQLLSLDRGSRPRSAAEVIERLSGIAGLELQELPEVSRAYLVAPTLVGRDAQLQAVRTRLVASMQGKGGSCFIVEGAEGMGRSRFLDACVLEAKLLGATVLRADASDASSGAYGIAKALAKRLFAELPDVARRSARPWRSILRALLPEAMIGAASDTPPAAIAASKAPPPTEATIGSGYSIMPSAPPPSEAPAPGAHLKPGADAPPEARAIQNALRDFLLSAARHKHIVIVVDDFEAIDAPSSAFIGVLAHGLRRRHLVLLTSVKTGTRPSPALNLLRDLSAPLPLEALTEEQSERMLRSIFGDTDRLAALNQRMYALAGGNPRWTMTLCERLVDMGLARYEAGSWALPSQLSSDVFPESLGAACLQRIAGLGDDARELAEALSLSDPSLLPADRYRALFSHQDAARAYQAIDALVRDGVLVPQGDRYRFAQEALPQALRTNIDPARARTLHGRLATVLTDASDPWRPAYHFLLGGREAEGLARMNTISRADPRALTSKTIGDVVALAADAMRRFGAPASVLSGMDRGMLGLSVLHANYERFQQKCGPILDRMLEESGFTDYQALPDTMPAEARLRDACATARRRLEAMPESLRGMAPEDAAAALRETIPYFVGMAATAQELRFVEMIPPLAPLFPLQPSLAVAQLQVDYQRHLQAGRPHLAEQTSHALLEIVSREDGGGLSEAAAHTARAHELHNLGLFAAGRGDGEAHAWVAEIESEPFYRANAVRVRMAYDLMHGNVDSAETLRRRAELFAVHDGIATILPGTSSRLELLVYSHTDDVIGVKRTMERLSAMAERFPNWKPTYEIARSQYLRIQGDLEGAATALQSALGATAPGRHIDWGAAAAFHVALLNAQGRTSDALDAGLRYLSLCEREDLPPTRLALLRPLAEAYMRAGRLSDALAAIEEHIATHVAHNTSGLPLGLAYETRARIAIAAEDEPGLRHYAELCAHEYKGKHNPALSNKYRGLIHEAELAGLPLTTGMRDAALVTSALVPGEQTSSASLDHTLNSRMLGCVDPAERALEGLRLLLETTGAAGGFLFGVEAGKLALLATLEENTPSDALVSWLSESLQAAANEDVDTDAEVVTDQVAPSGAQPKGELGYEPIVMHGSANGEVALIAALRYETPERSVVRVEVRNALVDVLAAQAAVQE